jgi:hypothetical protein
VKGLIAAAAKIKKNKGSPFKLDTSFDACYFTGYFNGNESSPCVFCPADKAVSRCEAEVNRDTRIFSGSGVEHHDHCPQSSITVNSLSIPLSAFKLMFQSHLRCSLL